MAITATSTGGGNYTPMEAGNYPARCYSMVHIGTVTESINGETKTQNKVRISWETPTELKVFKEEKGEQPYSLSKDFTLSMHEKSTLRKFLAGWRGKDFSEDECKAFDITVLVGKECMLNVIHKENTAKTKTYAEISSISKLPKGLNCPPQINESFVLSYDDWSEDKFNTLPDFIKDKMKTSVEYKALKNPQSQEIASVDDDSDMTFSNKTIEDDGPPF